MVGGGIGGGGVTGGLPVGGCKGPRHTSYWGDKLTPTTVAAAAAHRTGLKGECDGEFHKPPPTYSIWRDSLGSVVAGAKFILSLR